MKEPKYILQASRLGKTVYCDEFDGTHYGFTYDKKTCWKMDHAQAVRRLPLFSKQYEKAIIIPA